MNDQVAAAIAKLTNDFWLTTICSFIVSALGIFIGGYLLKKAGHLATKEDFSDFREQLQITTKGHGGDQATAFPPHLGQSTAVERQRALLRQAAYAIAQL